jgi:hypothetical protein
VLHCLGTGTPPQGPLNPEISRIGQVVVDAALRSMREKRTVTLTERP